MAEYDSIVDEVVVQSGEQICLLQLFTCKVESVADDVTDKVRAVHAANKSTEKTVKDACQDLSEAARRAYIFVEAVDSLYQYGKDGMDEVKEKIKNGDDSALSLYLSKLKDSMTQAEIAYISFKPACTEASTSALKAADQCQRHAEEARTKKNMTRAVGGAAAGVSMAAGIGGGVAASVIAGIFTFGVGTIIGLSLTAVGSVAAGAGVGVATAVATHVLASKFEEAETAFRKAGKAFDEVYKHSIGLYEYVDNIKEKLINLTAKIDAVDCNTKRQALPALETLQAHFMKQHQESSKCRNAISAKHKNFVGLIETLN